MLIFCVALVATLTHHPFLTLTHTLPHCRYTKNTAIKLVQKFGISEETAQHLARTYGTHAFDVCYLSKPTGKAWPRFGQVLVDGYPFVEAEIEYACKYEYVRTLKDMLTLR